MVISPTLDFSRAISSSRSSRSRSFKAVAAPASARSRHSVSLATETFVCRATKSSGSPRASGHSRRRPNGRLRQPWESAPAPLRARALHHSSCVTLRLRFNYLSRVSQLSVPHPKAEVGADHRIRVSSLPALTSILVTAGSLSAGQAMCQLPCNNTPFRCSTLCAQVSQGILSDFG